MAPRCSQPDGTGILVQRLMDSRQNYAGNRLSPWLGHLMVSRQESALPLLTPGEIMQLPTSDELVLVSGTPPIRAKKARYFGDIRLLSRVLPPPVLTHRTAANSGDRSCQHTDDWTGIPPAVVDVAERPAAGFSQMTLRWRHPPRAYVARPRNNCSGSAGAFKREQKQRHRSIPVSNSPV
jgi:Type IV secretory system Conjugative DNA transfer